MKKIKLVLVVISLMLSVLDYAQNRTVSGNVISTDDGLPVIGASVFVKGTKIGTVTDLDGNFTLPGVPADATTLEVAYLSMKTKEVPVESFVKVALEPDSEMLAEVVVTGMQSMDRRLFTGSTAKVDASEAKLDGMADVSRSLEGRVAGVSVQNVSGTFGTAPKIRVRGATSIYGSSKPLWVVDGVIMEDVVDVSADQLSSGDANTLISSAIAGLNSDDIESFDILKDGSATSIYGARAMAGVIVITTKKGRAGSAKLTYTGEFTTRLKPSYTTFNIMNSQDQMEIYQELQQKGYLNYASVSNASASGVFGKMYELVNTYNATSGTFGLANTPEAKAEYLRAAEYRNTDWFGILFSTGLQQNHSVSISGGSDKGTYYASGSIMNDPGWTKQSSVQRYTGNVNATYRFMENVTFNFISNASYRKQRAPGTLGQAIDVVSGEVKRDFDINPYSYALNTSRALDPNEYYKRNYAPFNIMNELDNNYIDVNVTDFRVQGELKYKPIKGLEFSAIGAMKYTSTAQEHYILEGSNQALAYKEMSTTVIRNANPFLYKDPDKPYEYPVSVLPNGGIYEKNDNSMLGYDFRATMNYSNTFKRDHIVNFFAGTEINKIERHGIWFRGWGMQYAMGETSNYDYRVFKEGSEQNSDYYTMKNAHDRSAAFFANGTYSYAGKYIFNGTIRYEGTNKLGKSRQARWLPTWNLSAAWNLHEEKWMKNLYPTISHLSLKASYSLTADRGPSSVTNSAVVITANTPWRPFTNVRETALAIEDLANTDLTYEKKRELNLGIETGLFDNRVNIALDWYSRNNYDLIGIINTQGIGGQVQKMGNIATMKSDGVELSLSTTNIKAKDFSWTSNFIYSHSHNVVSQLKTTIRVIDLVRGSGFAQEGYPVRGIFSIPFVGLNDEGLPVFKDQDGGQSVSGIYFQESDPEKLKFLEYSGNADPTDVGSFGNIFSYKGFRLNVFMTYSFGNVIRLDPVFRNTYNDLDSMPKEFANRWAVPGDEKYTSIPVIASVWQNRQDSQLSYAYNAYNYSTERIAKGDFIRMKEISFGYDFPNAWVEKLHLNALSLKLQATNLFLLYADKKLNGQDPEFANAGGVAVPLPKQFTFTVKIGL
ncbi:MAG: SusC/RagA family TonB-linked outer membrane protein [Bacteroidales bacterium]|nr:SusC/RagA family TonB-linked outer membrane protein [Bacteroidales bacterium]